ncbi:hypothetical protein PR002_g12680 [Phytophthora rubi]|uniref:Uncharacterized protein n=1 Tax=Phytophthora rubi TaxID=129364 RepID=A0A6A3LKG4_9STRA|nr:hypothetical protein PR002_g12680 [Phytophthora rubi]
MRIEASNTLGTHSALSMSLSAYLFGHLNRPLTTIKSLRLAVELARAPSQLSISTAMPTHQGSVNERRSLDAVSRYLSAEWKPCCKPLLSPRKYFRQRFI